MLWHTKAKQGISFDHYSFIEFLQKNIMVANKQEEFVLKYIWQDCFPLNYQYDHLKGENTTYNSESAGRLSAVGNVSDCRSRGCEFDPSPVPHFCGD